MSRTPSNLSTIDSKVFVVGDLRVDFGQQRVTRAGVDIVLPNLSFKLLEALIRAAPNVLGNEQLMAQVWPGLIVSLETVNKRVNLLRDALGDDTQNPRYIAGVRSRGYRLIASTAPAETTAHSAELPVASGSIEAQQMKLPKSRRRYWRLVALSVGAMGLLAAAAIGLRWVGPNDEPSGRATAIGVRSRTVAVLPFVSISPDASDAYLAQGLPEMILNRLSRINGLSVIARTSSFALITSNIDSNEIGRRLNTGYLVSGSVQREADRLRVAVQLIDCTSGTQVWSAHFDRALRDIFSVEDEIADQVAEALATRLNGVESAPIAKERSGNLEAHLSFLHGRSLLGRFTIAESNAAVPYFEKAIALDPQFASAYASLYEARMQAALQGSEHLPPLRHRYQPLIDRALTIDPQSGAAYFARAIWGDDSEANAQEQRLADFRRGLELDPSNGRGLTAYAEFLINDLGRQEEGMLMLQRAVRIDPMSPRAQFMFAVKSSVGAGSEVIEQKMLEILELDPNFVPALQRYAKLHWFFRGALAESVQVIERAIVLDPANPRLRNLAMAIYLDLDDVAAARNVAAGNPKSAAAARLLLALHKGDWRDAGLVARDSIGWEVGGGFENWGVGEALRDFAFKTGELDQGIALISSAYKLSGNASGDLNLFNFRQAVYLSQLLAAQGHKQQALELRRAAAAWNDANEVKHGRVYARRTRAAILLLNGKTDAALTELAGSFRSMDYVHWWYTIERDSLWLPLHSDPRFQVMAADVRRHVDAQRGELEALRRQGVIPRRDGSVSPE